MAELDVSGGVHKGRAGLGKGKKLSTRIDLTPMVDLGFLLITFFIFSTTMSKPTAKRLFLPKDVRDEGRLPVPRSAVLTIMLGGNKQVYYYEGDDPKKFKTSDFTNIRNMILDKKRRTDATWFMVILKPSRDATYAHMLNILDEMTIDAVNHYALVDISPDEYKLIQTKNTFDR